MGQLIYRRMIYQKTTLAWLGVAFVLLSTLFAFEPLYRAALGEASLRYELEQTHERQQRMILRDTAPIQPATSDLLAQQLGDLVTRVDQITRNLGLPEYEGYLCGYRYPEGNPNAASYENCYQVNAYDHLDKYFTLAAGRYPELLPATDDPMLPHAEAVVSTAVADYVQLNINDIIVVQDPRNVQMRFQVVGLVEPVDRTDIFWDNQTVMAEGVITWIGQDDRYDYALAILPEAFEQVVVPFAPAGALYSWQVRTNPDQVAYADLHRWQGRLQAFEREFAIRQPGSEVFNEVLTLLTQFDQRITRAQEPVLLLAVAILVLMSAGLLALSHRLISPQEMTLLEERGGTFAQLITVQILTAAGIALLAAIIAPFVAMGLLVIFDQVGMLAPILDHAHLSYHFPPLRAFAYSFLAAISSLGIMGLALYLERRHTETNPALQSAFFTRYFVDVALLLIGIGLLLRLFFLTSRDLDQLWRNPGAFFSGLSDGEALGDPVNLLAPLLLLVGIALLLLRLLPFLFRISSRFAREGIMPLVFWQLGRSPRAYANLSVLLMLTLALGTAAFTLHTTRRESNWMLAQAQVGGDVRLDFDLSAANSDQGWAGREGINGGVPLIRATETLSNPITLLGFDAARLSAQFPEDADLITPLAAVEPLELPGIILPDDLAAIRMQVFSAISEDSADPIQLRLDLALCDSAGIPFYVPMITADETTADQFVEYRADLPEAVTYPWRLDGIRIRSRLPDGSEFFHQFYIDDVTGIREDGSTLLLSDFEEIPQRLWETPQTQLNNSAPTRVQRSRDQALSGDASLRVAYRKARFTDPTFRFNITPPEPLPVIISQAAADFLGQRLRRDRQPLKSGDTGNFTLELPAGIFNVDFAILGVIDQFPTLTGRDRFMLAPADRLLWQINSTVQSSAYYHFDEAWLDLRDDQPGQAIRQQLATIPGVNTSTFAWDRYAELRSEPLAGAVTGIMYAGFWLTAGLVLLVFSIDIQHATFPVDILARLGWSVPQVRRWLILERLLVISAALMLGMILGIGLAKLMLPFLTLIRSDSLYLPLVQLGLLFSTALIIWGVMVRQSVRGSIK